ncbi:MAG: D-glycerate dehydrogenase [Betaproteobacteria bacterium]|jgi:gluconate 2-dehydrogenase|nr:D-glycerate dehydrogenase [Betaproteobacteria bacterium]NBP37424.1 D-glycerate dehydrogenase [Betaproteobacteria bacterium]NBQ78521.1 D-glycerate dehydrogenase [Betaproteobacteria bacterium]NBQ95201.1 D-glycerate dehydrogenase [Betaproteobacteria bacterium]NBS39266.1 D-glycerate dehydrogenase [Betaproteobacteria bacterium]
MSDQDLNHASTKPRLLITRRVFPQVLESLAGHFEIEHNEADVPWDLEEMRARIAPMDALYTVATDRIDASVIAAAPRLRMIATGSVGFNHIDLAACRMRGIPVSNTPDVLTEATADMAWALLMATARRVTESERWLRAGSWKGWAWDQFLGADLYGATLGIVGMGRIGCAIAKRAQGFSMRICYHNRSESAQAAALGASLLSLDELLASADHVMLVLPYSQATHHVIGEDQLKAMKASATLINMARGGIVDDAALAKALQQGLIAAAGLDVFEGEPAVHPDLLACNNIVLTPHIGSATLSSRLGMAMLAARNLLAWREGSSLLTPVPGL